MSSKITQHWGMKKAHKTAHTTVISLRFNNELSSLSSVQSNPSADNDSQRTPPVTTVGNMNSVEGVCDLSDITIINNLMLAESKLQIQLLRVKNKEITETIMRYYRNNPVTHYNITYNDIP